MIVFWEDLFCLLCTGGVYGLLGLALCRIEKRGLVIVLICSVYSHDVQTQHRQVWVGQDVPGD